MRLASRPCPSAWTSSSGSRWNTCCACLIALRLAEERAGLDDAGRSVVYYTALLVNVGCHADAHEQAKWFGDDIELNGDEYDYRAGASPGWRGLRCAWWATATRACAGSASAWSSGCPATAFSTG